MDKAVRMEQTWILLRLLGAAVWLAIQVIRLIRLLH